MIDKRLKYGTFDERTRVGVVANMFLKLWMLREFPTDYEVVVLLLSDEMSCMWYAQEDDWEDKEKEESKESEMFEENEKE
jgi:hypothetical protein